MSRAETGKGREHRGDAVLLASSRSASATPLRCSIDATPGDGGVVRAFGRPHVRGQLRAAARGFVDHELDVFR
jgi:hypothetical protein